MEFVGFEGIIHVLTVPSAFRRIVTGNGPEDLKEQLIEQPQYPTATCIKGPGGVFSAPAPSPLRPSAGAQQRLKSGALQATGAPAEANFHLPPAIR